MNDQELNKKVEDIVQPSISALRYELVNLSLSHDSRIKFLESKIKGLEQQILSLQMQGGLY